MTPPLRIVSDAQGEVPIDSLGGNLQRFLGWTCGDVPAAEFLSHLFAVSQVADDFVDDDIPPEKRSEQMTQLVLTLLLNVGNNPFFDRYRIELQALMASSLIVWDATNEWAGSTRQDTRTFAFVYREILEQVISFTAYVVGGLEHARAVTREVHQHYHVDHGEGFAAWESEHGR